MGGSDVDVAGDRVGVLVTRGRVLVGCGVKVAGSVVLVGAKVTRGTRVSKGKEITWNLSAGSQPSRPLSVRT